MRGFIDSLSFEFDEVILSKLHLIGVLTVVKSGALIFNDNLIREFVEFRNGKPFGKQLIEIRNLYKFLAILETQTGLQYKIMQHCTAKKISISFMGLKQYNETSSLMQYDVNHFLELFKEDLQLIRLDVALDTKQPFNVSQIAKNLNRTIKPFKDTTYFKTPKEKRVNRTLDVAYYFKKEVCLYRLEFRFKKRYFVSSNPVLQIEKTISKTIKKPFKFIDDFSLIC